jgi:pilus assembly protein Flp/PilA
MLLRSKMTIQKFRRLVGNRSGATAIEYALIAGGIAAVLVGTISTLGGNISTMWTAIRTALG